MIPILTRIPHLLASAAKRAPTGWFKPTPLKELSGAPLRLSRESFDPKKYKWPLLNPKKMVAEPVGHAKQLSELGFKNYFKNQWMQTKYHVNPTTRQVYKRSIAGRVMAPFGSAPGLALGAGIGAVELAGTKKPGKALGTAASWGAAPTLMATKTLGELGFGMLKKKGPQNVL